MFKYFIFTSLKKIYVKDYDCVTTMLTFEHLVLLCSSDYSVLVNVLLQVLNTILIKNSIL